MQNDDVDQPILTKSKRDGEASMEKIDRFKIKFT